MSGRWRVHALEASRAIQKVYSEGPPEHELPLVPPGKKCVMLENPGHAQSLHVRQISAWISAQRDLVFVHEACLIGLDAGEFDRQKLAFFHQRFHRHQ